MFSAAHCCCSPTCIIVNETTAISLSDWTQVSGSWSFSTPGDLPDGLISTTSSDGIIIHNTPHPQGLSVGSLRLGAIRIPASGTTCRMLMGYLDTDNHIFIEHRTVHPGPTAGIDVACRFGYRQGGSDTFLDNIFPASIGSGATTYTYLLNQGLCYNGARISSGLATSNPFFGGDCPLSGLTLGTQVGFQVIGNTGTTGFGGSGSNRRVAFLGENNAAGGACASCIGAAGGDAGGGWCDPVSSGSPKEYSVYLTGVGNGTCGNCAALFNGATFVIDENYASTGIRGDIIKNFPAIPAACTGMSQTIFPSLGDSLGNNPDTKITLRISGDGRFDFTKTTHLCNEILTKVNGVNIGTPQRCTWTGATAQITPNVN